MLEGLKNRQKWVGFSVKASLLWLVGIFFCATELQALTYQQYLNERDNWKTLAQNNKSSKELALKRARQSVDQKKAHRDQLIEVKKALLTLGHSRLTDSQHAKMEGLNDEIKNIKESNFQGSTINLKYTKNQQSYVKDYTSLLDHFQHYHGSETTEKKKLQDEVTLSLGAKNTSDLALAQARLIGLRKEESADQTLLEAQAGILVAKMKNTFTEYEEQLTPWQTFLTHYQISKIDPPAAYLTQLQHIQNYAHQRGEYFAHTVATQLPKIEKQLNDCLHTAINTDQQSGEKKRLDTALSVGFLDTIGALLKEEMQIRKDPENQSAFGCGNKLKPTYDFFQRVLVYQEQCQDVRALKQAGSPYALGCLLFKPVLQGAKGFFKSGAWGNIGFTLIPAEFCGPKALSPLGQRINAIKQLRVKENDMPNAILLEAIQLHDELLTQWATLAAAPPISPDVAPTGEGQ